MRLYLDTSVLNRPFDDVEQPRVWFESLALCFILSLVEFREAELVRSFMHDIENRRNRDPIRKVFVKGCLRIASNTPTAPNEILLQRAAFLQGQGFKFQDAWHLTLAEHLKADHFLTCDDAVCKRYSGSMKVSNPSAFISNLR